MKTYLNGGFWGLFLFSITVVLVLLVIFYFFVIFRPSQIKGSAMAPSYVDGQYYLINMSSIISGKRKRGDVVVYKVYEVSNNLRVDYFRRIIGLPGEEIEIRGGKVYINGQLLDESYLTSGTVTYDDTYLKEGQKLTIPQGQYFVMGDNRPHSSDSRAHGPIESIIGKITICYWNCNSSK